ncbi:MAG: shikimate dehydrogenase [Rhodomicrobium sp.]|nr:shikimate dehydrogenase [Rhodomicrobium sp.]
MKRACVIGWPVSHSLSPVIHGHWLKAFGIEGEYGKEAVEPKDFEGFLTTLAERGYCGANITVPHKIEAHRLCALRGGAAEAIGAVNTVWLEDGQLAGSNTDAFGFAANLDQESPGWDRGGAAAVIGAGGAARAIVWALVQRGFDDIRIVNRTKARAEELAAAFPPARAFDFGAVCGALDGARLAVNSSTLGMAGCPPLGIDLSPLSTGATVCDIVYHPLETPLLRQAREKGFRAVDGLGMLLHQAIPGFERWFGVRPHVTPELREVVLAAVKARESAGA